MLSATVEVGTTLVVSIGVVLIPSVVVSGTVVVNPIVDVSSWVVVGTRVVVLPIVVDFSPKIILQMLFQYLEDTTDLAITIFLFQLRIIRIDNFWLGTNTDILNSWN